MNILSDEQAAARQLKLPQQGLLAGLSQEFIDTLQSAGAFVEYNQQVVVAAGGSVDYISCIVAGRVKISRLDADYVKAEVTRLGAGVWFGETNLFVRVPATQEIFADGEVVIWTMPADTMRSRFFTDRQGAQLLFNIARQMAERCTQNASEPGSKAG